MAKETNIKDELLGQMDLNADPQAAKKIFAKDFARVRRLKWITIISWLIVAVCLVITSLVKYAFGSLYAIGPEWRLKTALMDSEIAALDGLIMAWRGLLLVAVISTVLLYVISRTLTISQIQVRLAAIEEMLKKMAQDKSASSEA